MSDEKKPREFDLYFVTDDDGTISPYDASICENNVRWTPNTKWAEPTCHVIEIAAYEALAAKLDIAKRAIEEAGCQDPTRKTVLNGGRFGDDVDVEAPCGECSVCLALKEIER